MPVARRDSQTVPPRSSVMCGHRCNQAAVSRRAPHNFSIQTAHASIGLRENKSRQTHGRAGFGIVLPEEFSRGLLHG